MENPNRSEHSPTRMKVLIVGDEGVGKYSLRAQAAWSAALTDGVYRTCVIDHSHISLEIPISRPPFQSETSVSSTETSSNARLAGKCLNWVNNLVKWVNGKISLILQPEEVQMKLEMSVLLYTPSPNEDQLRSNELYLRHSSVVALCYHIARPETLDNAINKVCTFSPLCP